MGSIYGQYGNVMAEQPTYRLPYELINEIIEEFDYIKVHECMVALNWKWGSVVNHYYGGGAVYETPDIETMKQATIDNLFKIVEELENNPIDTTQYYSSSGGFRYELEKENKRIVYVNMSFVVTDWSAFDTIEK